MTQALLTQRLAVLYGGTSAEREVSLNSGNAIAKGLQKAGFNVQLIDTKNFCLSDLAKANIDRVFIALHGRGGEDGCVQGALQYMNIPYTGSDVLGSALSMDKIRSKQVFQALDLPTAPFAIVHKHDYQRENAEAILAQLGNVVIVNPAHEGSSSGMSKASDANALHQSLVEAFNYDNEILVEAWIQGPEYTVAILGQTPMPAIHMETPHDFYDYDAKYKSTSTQYHCPCGLSKTDEQALQSLALKAFNATGAKGWGRVDVMRNQQGQWQLLEVNTVPGMTETSLVPKAAKVHGLSFSELVQKIVEISMEQTR
jgi:D-alanine-D-alanine ligase